MTWKHGDRSGGHGDRKGRHYDTTFVARFSVYSSGDPCGRHVSTLAVALFSRGGRSVPARRSPCFHRSLCSLAAVATALYAGALPGNTWGRPSYQPPAMNGAAWAASQAE